MKKALVIGGTQFFGKRLVRNLVDSGWDVTIATRGRTPDPFGDSVQRLIIDREDRKTLEDAFGSTDIFYDCVFDQSCYSPLEVKDALEVLEGRIGHYLFTSTMSVYDWGASKQESEYDPYTYPIELKSRREYIGIPGYKEAKRQAEAVLFQAGNVPATAFRFPLVIGEDDYTGRLQFHVDRVKAGQPIGIDNPESRLGYIDSEDAARFIQFAAEQKLQGPYNPGSAGDLSLQELLDRIAQTAKTEAIIVPSTEKESTSPYNFGASLSPDVSKAAATGFEFRKLDDLIDGLIHYYLHAE
ncbi:NAD-dependent epimerase/dehydratase family protein [Brevibacillus panacihumi]|uniref:NAD-dependent epimerase/dehydratase family protein n=1 Tax=Brevibacillus panacihumi TaxID=497735 RepID=A0A3M8CNE5_9BACL|nr:NAD-dependent epimerase/dehydratase family protein [Brevibacillus panacihumi]RNB77168.1 NAD-dependent epimerase/dehydratase family protein [Brevibacillus panacihumi]